MCNEAFRGVCSREQASLKLNVVLVVVRVLELKLSYVTSVNPLGPKSVQHQFSPNNMSRSSRVKVMRITKLMTKGRKL